MKLCQSFWTLEDWREIQDKERMRSPKNYQNDRTIDVHMTNIIIKNQRENKFSENPETAPAGELYFQIVLFSNLMKNSTTV